MQGDQPIDTNTNTSATPANDLSYPTAPEQEAASIPSQQVGFIPAQELEVKSKPIQPVSTNVEEKKVELEELVRQQAAKESPTPPVGTQPFAPTPTEPTTTVEPRTESITRSEQRGQELAALAQASAEQTLATLKLIAQPTEEVPSDTESKEVITTPEPPIEAKLQGQEAVELTQPTIAPEPIIPIEPEIEQLAPVSATPEQTETELETASIEEVQPPEPTKTPAITPETEQIEQEPVVATPAATSDLEERVTALEQKFNTFITEISKLA